MGQINSRKERNFQKARIITVRINTCKKAKSCLTVGPVQSVLRISFVWHTNAAACLMGKWRKCFSSVEHKCTVEIVFLLWHRPTSKKSWGKSEYATAKEHTKAAGSWSRSTSITALTMRKRRSKTHRCPLHLSVGCSLVEMRPLSCVYLVISLCGIVPALHCGQTVNRLQMSLDTPVWNATHR